MDLGERDPPPTSNEKCLEYKELWTEHSTTLIAYEAQYIYRKKRKMTPSSEQSRHSRKKVNRFESGFLFPHL